MFGVPSELADWILWIVFLVVMVAVGCAVGAFGARRLGTRAMVVAGLRSGLVFFTIWVFPLWVGVPFAIVEALVGGMFFTRSLMRATVNAEVEPCPVYAVPGGVWQVANEFQAMGFLVAGAVRVKPRSLPPIFHLILVSEPYSAYAYVNMLETGKEPSFTLMTMVANGQLVSSRQSKSIREGPDELVQRFPGARPDALLHHHLAALHYLRGRGVAVRPATVPDALPVFWQVRTAETEQLRTAPLLAYASYALSLPKVRRHRGPVFEHPDIEQRLALLGAQG